MALVAAKDVVVIYDGKEVPVKAGKGINVKKQFGIEDLAAVRGIEAFLKAKYGFVDKQFVDKQPEPVKAKAKAKAKKGKADDGAKSD